MAWVINRNNKSKINAVKKDFRRCCGVTLVDTILNEEIHTNMQVEKDTLTFIKKIR